MSPPTTRDCIMNEKSVFILSSAVKEQLTCSKKQWSTVGFTQLCSTFNIYHYTKSYEMNRSFHTARHYFWYLQLGSPNSVMLELWTEVSFPSALCSSLQHVCSYCTCSNLWNGQKQLYQQPFHVNQNALKIIFLCVRINQSGFARDCTLNFQKIFAVLVLIFAVGESGTHVLVSGTAKS